MKRAVGLWIDHRKAVIVVVTDQGETTSLILSTVEKQLGCYAGVRALGSRVEVGRRQGG